MVAHRTIVSCDSIKIDHELARKGWTLELRHGLSMAQITEDLSPILQHTLLGTPSLRRVCEFMEKLSGHA